jgi:hypothetical protein
VVVIKQSILIRPKPQNPKTPKPLKGEYNILDKSSIKLRAFSLILIMIFMLVMSHILLLFLVIIISRNSL